MNVNYAFVAIFIVLLLHFACSFILLLLLYLVFVTILVESVSHILFEI